MSTYTERENVEPEELEFEGEGLYFVAWDVTQDLDYDSFVGYDVLRQEIEDKLGSRDNYRSTDAIRYIDRVLEELEDKNWVESREGSYRLENPGNIIYRST